MNDYMEKCLENRLETINSLKEFSREICEEANFRKHCDLCILEIVLNPLKETDINKFTYTQKITGFSEVSLFFNFYRKTAQTQNNIIGLSRRITLAIDKFIMKRAGSNYDRIIIKYLPLFKRLIGDTDEEISIKIMKDYDMFIPPAQRFQLTRLRIECKNRFSFETPMLTDAHINNKWYLPSIIKKEKLIEYENKSDTSLVMLKPYDPVGRIILTKSGQCITVQQTMFGFALNNVDYNNPHPASNVYVTPTNSLNAVVKYDVLAKCVDALKTFTEENGMNIFQPEDSDDVLMISLFADKYKKTLTYL